jgi:trehalose 6-phosphate phosphatase
MHRTGPTTRPAATRPGPLTDAATSTSATDSLSTPPLERGQVAGYALFLDVDGTLLPFADRPDGVGVDARLLALVTELHGRLDGAVALVSGRTLPTLDALFRPLRLPAGGLHGLELRYPDGAVMRWPVDREALARLRAGMTAIVQRQPRLLLEDKGSSLALHYRQAPALAESALAAAAGLVAALGPAFVLQPGDHVAEVRPAGADKGRALTALMAGKPFAGRQPVMLGDDLTDEHAFAAAQRLGGFGVVVGRRRPTVARHALTDVGEVRAWLTLLARRLEPESSS